MPAAVEADKSTASVRGDVGVVVVSYGGADDTLAALASLLAAVPAPGRIVVVDNASGGDTAERLATWAASAGVRFARRGEEELDGSRLSPQPRVLIVDAVDNHGFAGGVNLGARALEGPEAPVYLVLLNNDATVAPDFLPPALAALDADPGIGLVGGTIRLMPPNDGVWFAGGQMLLLRCRGRHLRLPGDRVQDISFCTGCYMVIRRAAFVEVGGMPECYFLYQEDVEFCQRLREHGWRLVHVPASLVFHKAGAASGGRRARPETAYLAVRNRIWFARRVVGPRLRLLALAWVILEELNRAAGARLRGARAVSRAILRGLAHGLVHRWPEQGPAKPA